MDAQQTKLNIKSVLDLSATPVFCGAYSQRDKLHIPKSLHIFQVDLHKRERNKATGVDVGIYQS